MTDFNKDDVIKVAMALVGNGIPHVSQGDYGRHEYLFECSCC